MLVSFFAVADQTARLELSLGGVFPWLAALALILTAALGIRAYSRSGGKRSIGVVEMLRFLLVAAVLFALAQPEWVETETPDEDPLIAVLYDDSGSMETRDITRGDGIASRSEVVAERLQDELFAGALGGDGTGTMQFAGGRFELTASPISAALAQSEAAEGADLEGDGLEGGGADGEAASAALAPAGTDLAAPLSKLLDQSTLRAAILISDGDWNEGESPYDVAMRYRLKGIPIFTATVGSPTRLPDVALLPVDPPAFAIVGRPIDIPISIDSAMPRDVSSTIEMSDASGVLISEPLLIPAQRTSPSKLVFRPTAPGRVQLTVRVTPVDGELDEANNEHTFEIDVRDERLRVLLVESYPRWEYRYLRNALVRDPGVEVDCYLTHPQLGDVGGGPSYLAAFPPKELLSAYDVVFVGDVGLGNKGLSEEECDMIAGLVRDQASGLILMPGLGGGHQELQSTKLGELFPVDLDPSEIYGFGQSAEAQLVLTEAGRRSALTRLLPDPNQNTELWNDLPGFQWYAPVMRARAGSQVLAVHSSSEGQYGRVPLLVTRTARTGKVLFMGTDAAWRWREGYEDRFHYRFWGQVIRWMAYQRSMNVGESMRLFFTPDRPRARATIALNANVMDSTGAPLGGATVRARIKAPSGRIERIAFAAATTSDDAAGSSEAWGLYSATFQPREPGRHLVELECVETGAVLEAEIPVIGEPLERIGMPARFDVMEEIARITRGDVLETLGAEGIAERLRALPEPPPIVARLRVWSHPLLGALIVLLMAGFWIGRKMVGRV